MLKKIVITPLSSFHKKKEFDCGEEVLNAYLMKYASQDSKRNLAKHFAATYENKHEVLGYYSLSAASEEFHLLPDSLKNSLPRYPVPLARLSRLAVDINSQGKGVGKYLLMDAMHRLLTASDSMGIHALIIDAKHTKATEFYKKFGFIEFPDNPLTLLLPIKTIRKAFYEDN